MSIIRYTIQQVLDLSTSLHTSTIYLISHKRVSLLWLHSYTLLYYTRNAYITYEYQKENLMPTYSQYCIELWY